MEQNKPKKNMNEASEHSEQLEEIWNNLDCRRLLSHMSHDLRTPLNTVLGLTELAKKQSGDKEYVDYCLEKIDASAHFLLDIVNDILYMSKLDESVKLHEETINIADLFHVLAENTKAMAYEKKINLLYSFDKEGVKHVIGDSSRIRQVLQNILSNAVKFTPRFGRISFSLQQKLLPEERVKLIFTIQDTGVGISEEVQAKMFQPFTKEYTGSTTVYGGTGLGLAMCKRLVDMMDGQLEFHSVKGEGSDFKVILELPIDQKAEHKDHSKQAHEYNFAGKRVLLAEDNEINCEIAKRLLTRQGLKVETAENGQIAVNKFMMNAPGTFDLILMDVRMPYMDGLMATRKIRASGKSDAGTIPIMAMTANAYDEDVQKSMDAGMNAHLVKPVDPQILYDTIQQAIDGTLEADVTTK